MAAIASQYRPKRVYEVTSAEGRRQLRLSDRIVELGEGEFDWYQKVAAWALPLHQDRQPAHASLLRARARQAHQATPRQALRRGMEPLSLLHEVAEASRLQRAADRRVGAAANDARALELHAPGRAARRPRLLDLLGGAGGYNYQSQDVQSVLREVGRAVRHPQGGDRAHLPASRPRRAVPALGSVQGHPRPRARDLRGARLGHPRLRTPARRAHLAVD